MLGQNMLGPNIDYFGVFVHYFEYQTIVTKYKHYNKL